MNKEEFIGKLQMVYFGDRNAFNEIVDVYDELKGDSKHLNDLLDGALNYKFEYEFVEDRDKYWYHTEIWALDKDYPYTIEEIEELLLKEEEVNMSEKGILKKIDDIFNYCEEIDNHLPKEEQTGYEMLPDIFYIKKEVHKLQQKVEQLENIRKEAIEYIKDKQKIQYKFALSHIECDDLLNILNKEE